MSSILNLPFPLEDYVFIVAVEKPQVSREKGSTWPCIGT